MVAAWSQTTGASDERLDEAVRRLAEALHPECIYLFGSRARGDATADSDYDLMVIVSESPESSLHLAQRAYHAITGVHLPMDILVWTRACFDWQAPVIASLPAAILREGRVLYAA